MKKTFKYNLNYISGITEYQRRAIYTLHLKENEFSIDGIFKRKNFLYSDIIDIKFGEVNDLMAESEIIRGLLFKDLKLLDRRIARKLKYCLVIVLKDTTIVFAEEFDMTIKNAYNTLCKILENNRQ